MASHICLHESTFYNFVKNTGLVHKIFTIAMSEKVNLSNFTLQKDNVFTTFEIVIPRYNNRKSLPFH